VDFGRLAYAPAYERQVRCVDEVIAARDAANVRAGAGYVLFVEHDPVITVSRRAGARDHLLATPELLAHHGVDVAETDRGGDITYHGPGQQVVYPILDLNRLNLGLHDYMRMLEDAVIDLCAHVGVRAGREAGATGVWVESPSGGGPPAKICAMGVRVRRWVSMHGLAINVTTNLDHFGLIVPCGLAGRPVTSLQRELGDACPTMANVRVMLEAELTRRIREHALRADLKRGE